MKTRIAAFAAVMILTFTAAAVQAQENKAAVIGRLMQDWQARMLSSGWTMEDVRSWARRNRAKLNGLNAERLALAQNAGTLDELDLVMLEAPVSGGARLDALVANIPGDIAMIGAHSVAKSSPATSPSSYAGLVFTALSPCRILDTRASQGGSGAWLAGSSNTIKIGPYATGYQTGAGAQGGSATSCGLDALAGPGQIATVMAAVSTVSQAGAGYLTFYPQGAPNPGLSSVSQWYQPGYVQTSFVLIPSDLTGAVTATGFTSATTDVIVDVVGYFALPQTAAVPTVRFHGPIGTVLITLFGSVFAGPTVTVTTTATQRLTGTAMLPLAVTSGATSACLDLCYQPSPAGGSLLHFVSGGGCGPSVTVSTARVSQAVSGTVIPGAGTWVVGACVGTNAPLNNNDDVDGYIQITN